MLVYQRVGYIRDDISYPIFWGDEILSFTPGGGNFKCVLFSPWSHGEMIQFDDQFFQRGLVQPPTSKGLTRPYEGETNGS